jgi:hypothetical protein
MTVTANLVEAYLKCPTKCFLRWLGEASTSSEYADFVQAQQTSYRSEGINRLTQALTPNECGSGSFVTLIGKRAKWHVTIGSVARSGDLESAIDALRKRAARSAEQTGTTHPDSIHPHEQTHQG